MTDQQNAAPPVLETKDLPHGYAPAPVPFGDSTHIEREQAPVPADEVAETTAKKLPATRKTAADKEN